MTPPSDSAASNHDEEFSSFVLAKQDLDFLERDELLAIRIGLELLKPELILREQKIQSTVIVFGSARLPEPLKAQESLKLSQKEAARLPMDSRCQREVVTAKRRLELSRYYEVAREFSRVVSSTCQIDGNCDYVMVTGGGPGIMEAANRGAHDVKAKSVSLNIALPHEQRPNAYVTPSLCFQFQYFAIRKMHFLIRAKALVAFPGGFGTLDELFEVLTLVQTGKKERLPIILMGRAFWERLINWQMLVEEGLIDEKDLSLFYYAETAQEAWDLIVLHAKSSQVRLS